MATDGLARHYEHKATVISRFLYAGDSANTIRRVLACDTFPGLAITIVSKTSHPICTNYYQLQSVPLENMFYALILLMTPATHGYDEAASRSSVPCRLPDLWEFGLAQIPARR